MSVIKEGQRELLLDLAGTGVTRTPQYMTFVKDKKTKVQQVVLSPVSSDGSALVSFDGTVLTIAWADCIMKLCEANMGATVWKTFIDAENLWQAYLDGKNGCKLYDSTR